MQFITWAKKSKKQVSDVLSARSLHLALGLGLVFTSFSNFFRKEDERTETSDKGDRSAELFVDVSSVVGAEFKPIDFENDPSSLSDLIGSLPEAEPQKDPFNEVHFVPLSNELNLELLGFDLGSADLLALDKGDAQGWIIENYQVYTLGYVDDAPIGLCYLDEERSLFIWDLDAAYLLGGLGMLVGGNALYNKIEGDNTTVVTNPAVITGVSSGGLIEDTLEDGQVALTQTGQLTVVDEDAGESFFQTDSVTKSEAALGVLEITTDGAWQYTVDNADVQYLAEGETKDEVFTVLSADGTEQAITITITGVNDAPTVSEVTSVFREDAESFELDLLSASAANDIDGDTMTFIENSVEFLDSDSIDTDGFMIDQQTGQIIVTPDYYSYLNEGETVVVGYKFKVTDGIDEVNNTAIFTILGEADAAIISGDVVGGVTEDDLEDGQVELTKTGKLTVVDEDTDESFFQINSVTKSEGALGVLEITAYGAWEYTVDNADVQYLAEGETKDEVFTVLSADGTEQAITITITGVNDAATIIGDSGLVTEDAAETLGTSGNAVVVTDTDTGESTVQVQANAAGSYGSFSIDANGSWTYSADNTQLEIQALGEGETLTDSFTVTSADGSATNNVVITINGANDAPTVSAVMVEATESDEPDFLNLLSASNANDIDGNAVTFAGNVSQIDSSVDGGGISILEDTGDVLFNPSHYSYLNEGETVVVGYQFKVTDGIDVVNNTATFTILGEADAAVISGDVVGGVTEDDLADGQVALTQTGQLTVVDEDAGESFFQTESVIASAGALGVLEITTDGAWQYTVDNADVQYLAEGETKDEVFTVLSADGTEQAITITITGVNDAPTVSEVTSVFREDAESFELDLLSASAANDIDGDTMTFIENSVEFLDSDSIDTDGFMIDQQTGQIIVTPDYYSYLNEGETVVVGYKFKVTDGIDEVNNTAIFTILGEEPPRVEINIEQPTIDEVAMLSVGTFDVRFTFSEPVTGFAEDDVDVSLGSIVSGSLRVDESDNTVWYAQVEVTPDDFAEWTPSNLATIEVADDRFVDQTETPNLVGDTAFFRVFAEEQYAIADAVVMVDNFVHPYMLEGEDLENLVLQGTDQNDFIDGYTGDDILYGLAGDDVLLGNTEDDTLLGAAGNDVLVGGEGDDFSFGGMDNDIYYADLLEPERNAQDLFIGGEGEDIAYFSMDTSNYSFSVMNAEQKNLINQALNKVFVSDAQLTQIYDDLTSRLGEDETAFIKLYIDSLNDYQFNNQFLSREQIEGIEEEFGSDVADIFWMLPGFREIAIGDYDELNDQQVIEVTYLEPQADGSESQSSTHTTYVQAETLVFNGESMNVIEPVIEETSNLVNWTGTQQNDLFLVDLEVLSPSVITPINVQLNNFEVGKDTVDISGVYTLSESDSAAEKVDINSLLSEFALHSDGGSAEIDLDDFVDNNGASLDGSIKISFSETMNTISADSFVSQSGFLENDNFETELLTASLNS